MFRDDVDGDGQVNALVVMDRDVASGVWSPMYGPDPMSRISNKLHQELQAALGKTIQVDLHGKTLERLIWINFADATLAKEICNERGRIFQAVE